MACPWVKTVLIDNFRNMFNFPEITHTINRLEGLA